MTAKQTLLAFYKAWLQEADAAKSDSTWRGAMNVQRSGLCELLNYHLRGADTVTAYEAKRDTYAEFWRMHAKFTYPFNNGDGYVAEMNAGRMHLNELRYDFVKTQIARLEADHGQAI